MRDALILAGVIVAAVAAFFPAAETARVEPPAQPARTPIALPASTSPSQGGAILQRAGNGHFYAPVDLGTGTVTTLVDTGASVIALTGDDARSAGIAWDPARLTVVAQGAGGPVRGVPVTLGRVRLGGSEARGVAAVVIPEGLPISLLGQSFLRTVEPLRIEQDRMMLGGPTL